MSWWKIFNPDGSLRTVETIRELRYHSTGGPHGWKPDPRMFTLPSGRPARRTRDGIGCATYAAGMMFWGTPEAVDKQAAAWEAFPLWARNVLMEIDRLGG